MNNVIPFNSNDFLDNGDLITNATKRLTFVMFKANWCGHCQRMYPDFVKAGNSLTATNVRFAVYESTYMQNASKMQNFDYKIEGYPTVAFYWDNKFIGFYNGNRSSVDLIKFALNKLSDLQRHANYF